MTSLSRLTWVARALRDSTYPFSVNILLTLLRSGFDLCFAADAILDSKLGVPLRGAAIGNGWIDARRQYPSYIDYAVKVGILEANSDVRIMPVSHVFLLTIDVMTGLENRKTKNGRMRRRNVKDQGPRTDIYPKMRRAVA